MQYNDFTVVLPTLNEGRNIAALVSRLKEAYKGIRVIVTDDGSRDNTREESMRMEKKYGAVAFIDRKAGGKSQGLTASVIDGIMASRTRFVVVMDADMQHPYSVVKEIADKLRSGDILVVGVRAGVEDWPLYRKAVSRALMLAGNAVLVISGAQNCSDIFSGFFGLDRKFFIRTYRRNRRRFVGSGFKILFDLLKCIDRGSANVSEAPYIFKSRKFGKSKAGARQALDLLRSFVS